MTAEDGVDLHIADGIATVTLRNPRKHNAISITMWAQCGDVANRLAADDTLRVVVLRGYGDRAFASGADISEFSETRQTPEEDQRYTDLIDRACAALAALPVPTVAMIHGYCIGGGMALAVSCDLRIGDDDATFAIPAARLGVGYMPAGVKRIMDLVGPAYAKEILFTGARLDASRALGMGLLNRIEPAAALEAAVAELAATLRDNAPLTLRAAKGTVEEWLKPEHERDFAAVTALIEHCHDSDDFKEGQRAFAEKRPPVFRGH